MMGTEVPTVFPSSCLDPLPLCNHVRVVLLLLAVLRELDVLLAEEVCAEVEVGAHEEVVRNDGVDTEKEEAPGEGQGRKHREDEGERGGKVGEDEGKGEEKGEGDRRDEEEHRAHVLEDGLGGGEEEGQSIRQPAHRKREAEHQQGGGERVAGHEDGGVSDCPDYEDSQCDHHQQKHVAADLSHPEVQTPRPGNDEHVLQPSLPLAHHLLSDIGGRIQKGQREEKREQETLRLCCYRPARQRVKAGLHQQPSLWPSPSLARPPQRCIVDRMLEHSRRHGPCRVEDDGSL
eukprot:767790-Hanusia_phi.AAC.3